MSRSTGMRGSDEARMNLQPVAAKAAPTSRSYDSLDSTVGGLVVNITIARKHLRKFPVQRQPLHLEPRSKRVGVRLQFYGQLAGRHESDLGDFADVRPQDSTGRAEKHVTQFVFRASVAETRLITEFIDIFQCRRDVELVA